MSTEDEQTIADQVNAELGQGVATVVTDGAPRRRRAERMISPPMRGKPAEPVPPVAPAWVQGASLVWHSTDPHLSTTVADTPAPAAAPAELEQLAGEGPTDAPPAELEQPDAGPGPYRAMERPETLPEAWLRITGENINAAPSPLQWVNDTGDVYTLASADGEYGHVQYSGAGDQPTAIFQATPTATPTGEGKG